ncbi:unnamed protein product, partial [Arctia plantaginis]
ANLQRKKLATSEVLIEAGKRKVAVALLQEPYVGGLKGDDGVTGECVYSKTPIAEKAPWKGSNRCT